MLRKYSSYVLCFLISLFVVALYINDFSPLEKLEWKIQDFFYSFRGDNNFSADIVLVNIDEKALKEFGDWPWRRDNIADLLAAVGSGEPKTILLDILFDPDITEDTLGNTEILAGQMSWIKNVILPYELSPAEFMSRKISNPDHLNKYSVEVGNDLGILDENSSLLAYKVFLPPEIMCEYAGGLGFKYNVFDNDRKIRWMPLVMNYEGYYYPSAVLITAANYLRIPPSGITIRSGEYVQLGSIRIPANDRNELFINYNKPNRSFATVSATDILSEKYKLENFKNKLVIMSVSSEFVTDFYYTPVSSGLKSAELTANAIENIVHSNFITRFDSSTGRDTLILILLGVFFAFLLPRVSLMYRMIILIGTLFLLANANVILFNSLNVLTRSLYFGLELVLLLIASPFLDNVFLSKLSSLQIGFKTDSEPARLPKVELPERRAEVSAHIPEPRLERKRATVASERPPRQTEATESAPTRASVGMPSGAMPTQAELPAMDEKKREEQIPARPTEHAIEHAPAPNLEEPQVETESPAAEEGVDVRIGSDSAPIRSLGRYKVLGILGKGAMGTVYKGTDPAINRNVALKTIRFDFVNDPEELAELKERLYREAQAAGKLSHPNIVTIYDVGTEKKLQYIAMEYLEGETLEDMIRRKVKFNLRIIAQIITQICAALDYAHSHGIVHRDIKPANIMVLKDYRVKVMDFGIARVDSSSMTRTGIAMGTPNYISPEQLQGKSVDRQSDIFSLGVLMYEMLLHRRPFRGENLTALIYNIVNHEPEVPSTVDKSIPLIFDRVIEKALKKDAAQRYQNASEISMALADFIDSFAPKRAGTV
ncbi:MAG: CHASE2 domain-containing protein [Candidatus Zixiibacteriota bacterium]|nr:MAG: CHASE2 domain-containing protein [candidate division Zixibacteria bacterium]